MIGKGEEEYVGIRLLLIIQGMELLQSKRVASMPFVHSFTLPTDDMTATAPSHLSCLNSQRNSPLPFPAHSHTHSFTRHGDDMSGRASTPQ